MPDTTTIQSLPLIQASQAQKHVTHNEALKILDLIVQLSVLTRDTSVPPPTPVLGESHIVPPAASGVWAGQDNAVATFTGIVWEFYPPVIGWQAYLVAEAAVAVFDGAHWVSASEGVALFSELGISASPSNTNRLAVSSPASLFDHAGAGHQLKVNKASAGDTASLMFQTGYSGRAEMGTTGSDDFAIKVSADGAIFTEAVAFDRTSGRTKVQQGLRLTPAAGDLAGPVDGELWYDGTAGKLRARQGGASVDVIPGGTSGTFSDGAFALQDDGDASKEIRFELSGLTTATTRSLTVPDASGTLVLTAASQTLTNKSIAADQLKMSGGGTAQDYAGFVTRAALVSWVSGKTPPAGTILAAAGFFYRYIASGSVISDLAGWVPMGYAYPDHWAQNVSPGTTDMAAAIMAALGYSATVYMAGGIYAVGSTVAWDNATLIGNNDRGTQRTRITGLSASIPIGQAVVAPGRSSTLRGIQIAYDALTGTETQDQRVGLDTRGLSQTLQRGSVIDEVVFDTVGTAISDYGSGEFSVTYGTLEISSHSYRAVDIRGTSRTGSVWQNLYINGGSTYTPEGGFCHTGQGAGGMIGQLNVEHGTYSGYPVRLEGEQGLVINALHIEGVDCTTANLGYVGLDSSSVTIHSLNVFNTRMSADGTAVIRLARGAYQSLAAPSILATASTTSNLQIGKLNLKGLASPSNSIYPTYPAGRTGVRNCAGFAVFKRDTSYADSNWLVEVQDYLWGAFAAQSADRPYLDTPDLLATGSIQFKRMAERGANLVPYDNMLLNGAFDKWLATTATVTAGSQEVASKWTLRGTTGSVTVDRVQEVYGALGQWDARITVVTAGTGQSWDQDVAFPVEWLGQTLRLTFDMKATVAGRVFEQISATLQNNGGGAPATVFKQVLSGTNSKLDATTGFQTYQMDFTAVDPGSLTTLGTAAVMRLAFQFNDTTASRAPVVTLRNVGVAKVAGTKFARAPYDRLALSAADVSGLGSLATAASVSLTTQATGTLQAAQEPAHSGDVTNPAGSLALTIATAAVSNAKLATMAAGSLKGNGTGATAAPSDLTGTQVTALLDTVTSGAKGLAPASGGGTANYLRADGSWAAPPSTAPGGSTTQIQVNTAGAFGGASEVLVENNQLRLPATTSFTAPAAGGTRLVARTGAGRTVPAFLTQDGLVRGIQTAFSRSSPMIWKAAASTVSLTTFGTGILTAVGTATSAATASTNLFSYTPRVEYLVTTPATTNVAGFRYTNRLVSVGGSVAGVGGFHLVGRWGPATGVATTTNRGFFGLANLNADPTDVEPSTTVNCIAMGWDAGDVNVQMMFNDGSGTCSKTDLGGAFVVPTTDRTAVYELELYSPKGTTQTVYWTVTDLVSGATASGTITTDLPGTTTMLMPRGWMSVGGTSSEIGLALSSLVLDPLL
ncbi:MAG: DUF2793 domain-containing protein [bacterium]